MKKLTLDILDAISPEYQAYQNIRPLTERQNAYTSLFSLNNQGWENHYKNIAAINFNWQEIKYDDVVNKITNIDHTVPNLPGIYLFIVKPSNLINDLPKFVYYVGLAGAQGGARTLRARLKDYFAKSHLKKRDPIRILIYKHFANIYISYSSVTLPVGMTLEQIETSLIGFYGTHLLANRDDIPIELKPQTKSFNI